MPSASPILVPRRLRGVLSAHAVAAVLLGLGLGPACESSQGPGALDGELSLDAGPGHDGALAPDGAHAADNGVDHGAGSKPDASATPLGHPLALFFRVGVENPAGRDYAQWSQTYGRLNGFVAKALDEEPPGRIANIADFTRFKEEHPDQIVLLHFDGATRAPSFDRGKFFAGHWLHHPAATILGAVPKTVPASGLTSLEVSDVSLFRVGPAFAPERGDHVTLCAQAASGGPDWAKCEETTLHSITAGGVGGKGAIVVKRAQHGTSARAFSAGAFAAAHALYGPLKDYPSIPLGWAYNFATHSPADAAGKRCYQVLAEDLAPRFLPGGELAAFDGIEFDVLFFNYVDMEALPGAARPVDFDGDGKADPTSAVVGGVNRFGLGVYHFTRLLRQALPGKLILADGASAGHQRSFEILNGIESEGWPSLRDPVAKGTGVGWMNDWSGGLNRHAYWAAFSPAPRLGYLNHKYQLPGGGAASAADVPWGVHRLVMAAAVLLEAAFTGVMFPSGGDGLWDEMVRGTARERNWLGQPLGPAVHLATTSPDLLGAPGKGLEQRLKGRLAGTEVSWSFTGGALQLTSSKVGAAELAVAIKSIPVSGPDLVVTLTARAEQRAGYPAPIARLARVQYAPHGAAFAEGGIMTWVGTKEFTSTFYFKKPGGLAGTSGSVDLRLWFEGGAAVEISKITFHAQPDAMCREFDHGLVLANPGDAAHAFELAARFPGKRFRRLKGSTGQDTKTNSGAMVGAQVTLPALDGLFLERAP